MSGNKKLSILAFSVVTILAIGAIAKNLNEKNHYKMALEKCGSENNVKHFDSKGFECVKSETATDKQ
ncbi:hypothetical protein [Pseudoalteromonas sp. GB56]